MKLEFRERQLLYLVHQLLPLLLLVLLGIGFQISALYVDDALNL